MNETMKESKSAVVVFMMVWFLLFAAAVAGLILWKLAAWTFL